MPGRLERAHHRVVVRGHHGAVAAGRDDGLLGEQQVDLRAAPSHPGRALAERAGGLDGVEPEQRPEPALGGGVALAHLERDVLERHGSRRARRSQSIWFCLRMITCSMRCSSASDAASWPEWGMTACSVSVTSSSVSMRWSSAFPGSGSHSSLPTLVVGSPPSAVIFSTSSMPNIEPEAWV